MASIPKRRSFLFDRFWRIYPLWFIAVLPWILQYHPGGSVLAASLTLWPVYDRMVAPVLLVGWTLSFEMLFYFAIAASVYTGPKPLLTVFGVMLAGAVLIREPIFDFLGNPMIFEFLFGVAIARLPKDGRFSIPLLIGAAAWFALSPTWVPSTDLAMRAPASAWRVLYWGVPAAAVVYACLSAEKFFVHRYWAIPVLLGNASYSIYLFHLDGRSSPSALVGRNGSGHWRGSGRLVVR